MTEAQSQTGVWMFVMKSARDAFHLYFEPLRWAKSWPGLARGRSRSDIDQEEPAFSPRELVRPLVVLAIIAEIFPVLALGVFDDDLDLLGLVLLVAGAQIALLLHFSRNQPISLNPPPMTGDAESVKEQARKRVI